VPSRNKNRSGPHGDENAEERGKLLYELEIQQTSGNAAPKVLFKLDISEIRT